MGTFFHRLTSFAYLFTGAGNHLRPQTGCINPTNDYGDRIVRVMGRLVTRTGF
jgi:hypothetical protein